MTKREKIAIGIGVTVVAGMFLYAYRAKLKRLAKRTFGGQLWFDQSLAWWRNAKTKSIIEGLHPDFRGKAKRFFDKVEKDLGIQLVATSGFRTAKEQSELNEYIKAPPNLSYHNYGYAIDLNGFKDGKNILSSGTSRAEWVKSGVPAIAKKMGILWGVNDGAQDRVHFYMRPSGKTASELYALKQAGKVDKEGFVLA